NLLMGSPGHIPALRPYRPQTDPGWSRNRLAAPLLAACIAHADWEFLLRFPWPIWTYAADRRLWRGQSDCDLRDLSAPCSLLRRFGRLHHHARARRRHGTRGRHLVDRGDGKSERARHLYHGKCRDLRDCRSLGSSAIEARDLGYDHAPFRNGAGLIAE